MPSSMVTTSSTNGGTVPSAFLHKQLDITLKKFDLTLSTDLPIVSLSIRSGSAYKLNPATGLGDATVP